MGEHNIRDGAPQWMSITGQPLDLGLHDAGFEGTTLPIHFGALSDPMGQANASPSVRMRSSISSAKAVRMADLVSCPQSSTDQIQLTASSTAPENVKPLELSH